MKFRLFFTFSLLLSTSKVFPIDELPFPKIWEQVVKNSPETKSILLEKESSDKSIDRLSRYWMPSLYANSQIISTNDPTLTFMNYLGEGQVRQDDFITSHLNSPSNNVFNSTQIGVDFLLYDGDSRVSYLKSQSHYSKALDYEQKEILLKQYMRTISEYSQIILVQNYENEVTSIEKNLTSIIKNYHVGERSNPIGYSGLLSLKSIQNKINSIKEEITSKIKISKKTLNLMSGNENINWNTNSIPIEKFVSTYFFNPDESSKSYQFQAEIEKSNSINEKITSDNAKYLPKVGVFSQANIYGGDRGVNPAYVLGAYLKFNFTPSDYGSAEETTLIAQAKKEGAQALALSESISKNISQQNIESIKNKLVLLKNDENITDEQIKVLTKLFNNGNISMSQIADILNKRIDLIINKYSLKEVLLNSNLQLVSLTNKSLEPKDIWSLK